MSVRTSTIVLALATIAAPAFAQSAQSVFVGGEQGWIDQPVQSRLTSQQVTSEYLAFRRNPAGADGGQFVGGEMGYVLPAHTYARVNGQWVCTDKIAHNPPPAAIKSPVEQRAYQAHSPA
jgi:hypothetical protein